MEKITVLIIVLSAIFIFCHPYVIMPNVNLNLVENTTYYLHERFEFKKINFYPHKK